MTTLSDHAHAAKLIRAKLKQHNIKATVHAKSYAGGDSVRVRVFSEPPWTIKAIKSFCNQFEMGHFNAMEDLYEYSNTNDNLPQVKFVFVHNEFSTDDHKQAFSYLCKHFAAYENFTGTLDEHDNDRGMTDWVSSEVWQVLNGSLDKRCNGIKYWNKPQMRLTA